MQFLLFRVCIYLFAIADGFRRRRFCRLKLESFSYLARQFSIGKFFANELRYSQVESLCVGSVAAVLALPVVVSKCLFVEITKQVKRLDAHIGARDATLKKRPKILKAICMYATIHVLHSMVNHLMSIIGFKTIV